MLTSGRQMSSARRERPISTPMVSPKTAASPKPDKQADDGVEGVVRQNAGDGEIDEGARDLLQRRKQLAREYAGAGDDLPDRADHDEGKRVARDHAQTFAARDSAARARTSPRWWRHPAWCRPASSRGLVLRRPLVSGLGASLFPASGDRIMLFDRRPQAACGSCSAGCRAPIASGELCRRTG